MTNSLYTSQIYLSDLKCTVEHSVGISTLRNSTILVTGANGLIGSFVVDVLGLCNELFDFGLHIIATARNIDRLNERFQQCPFEGIQLIVWDVCDAPEFDYQIDFIIHTASNAHPASFTADPVGTILANVDGLKNAITYGMQHGMKRILYTSSGEVYGICDSSLKSFDENCYGYVDLLSPRSSYPMSKRMAETLCISYVDEFGVDAVMVRPSHTYGPNATPADSRANAQFVNDALAGRNIVMQSSGGQLRSYNYISDAVSGLLTVLVEGENGHAYNLGNPHVKKTIADFAQEVAKTVGLEVVFSKPDEALEKMQTPIPNQVLDTTALEKLGWTPAYSFAEGVQHTMQVFGELENA